jgi:hypothetical protein
MDLLIAILVAYGITNIVVQGSIFYSLREWFGKKTAQNGRLSKVYGNIYKLLNCPMCFGFWAGVLVSLVFGPFPVWNIIFNGALYSGTTWIIFCLTQFLGQGNDPNRTVNVMFQNELLQKTINTKEADQPPTKPGA